MNAYQNVASAIFYHAEKLPEKTALICPGETVTYGQLQQRATAFALELLHMGVKPGDRIVYAMRPSAAFFYTYLAAGMIGAVVAGVAFQSTAEAASVILREITPKVVVCEDSLYEQYHAMTDVAVIPCSEILPLSPHNELLPVLRQLQDAVTLQTPFLILYTSGTTKRPKGAVLTHGNVLASSDMQNTCLYAGGFNSADIIQHCFPVNHVSGAVECGIAPLVGGGCLILLPAFDPRAVLENTVKYRATVLCGVPAMWVMLFRCLENLPCDLSSVHTCLSGAAPLSSALTQKISAIGARCINPLGMTESSGFCSCFPAGFSDVLGTVGKIMPGIRYKLVGSDGLPVKTGDVGQICYAGDSIISRYVFGPVTLDAEGYFRSGDMATEDENGLIRLCGRSDDMFTVGGYNVYPQEVEDLLVKYPGVTGAVVLPIPHHTMGNVCRAYLTVSREVDPKDIENFVAESLIYYKVPRNYVILDRFPVNALGKVSKSVLTAQIREEFKDQL